MIKQILKVEAKKRIELDLHSTHSLYLLGI